jgi:Tfp pilus assembly protein PilN
MRPVNLIPTEERRGERAPMRSGPLAYVVVGALVAALLGVTLVVITDNQISDRKAEVTRLHAENAAAEARAARLAAYTKFHQIRDQRIATVASLADSRFDWERVMRELALVLPKNVWLTNLTGTDSPSVQVNGGAGVSSLRDGVPGPALEMVGCATGQDAVAGFVSALRDIDGVTRVGVQSSQLATSSGSSSSGSGASTDSNSSSASATCQTRKFIAQFQIVAAFDAAPVPADASAAAAASPAPTTTTSTSDSTSTTGSTSTTSTTPSSGTSGSSTTAAPTSTTTPGG